LARSYLSRTDTLRGFAATGRESSRLLGLDPVQLGLSISGVVLGYVENFELFSGGFDIVFGVGIQDLPRLLYFCARPFLWRILLKRTVNFPQLNEYLVKGLVGSQVVSYRVPASH
jgi:hypothetical protein